MIICPFSQARGRLPPLWLLVVRLSPMHDYRLHYQFDTWSQLVRLPPRCGYYLHTTTTMWSSHVCVTAYVVAASMRLPWYAGAACATSPTLDPLSLPTWSPWCVINHNSRLIAWWLLLLRCVCCLPQSPAAISAAIVLHGHCHCHTIIEDHDTKVNLMSQVITQTR